MNNIIQIAINGIIDYLLFETVTAAVLVGVAWGTIRLGKIKSPAHLHMVWLITLITIVIMPLLWLYGPKLTLSILPTLPIQNQIVATSLQPANFQPVTHLVDGYSFWSFLRDTNIFVWLWCTGFILLSTRLLMSGYRISRIMHSATPVSDDILPKRAPANKIKLMLTSQVNSPVCFGLLRPVILLPEHIYRNSSREELQMVLYHELAHIERKDCWINLFQRVVEAVLFYHPFVWYASSQLTNQREQLCDNHVIAEGISPKKYIQMLTRIVEQGFETKCFHAVALVEGKLLARARGLLELGMINQIKATRRVKVVGMMVTVICLAMGTIRLEADPGDSDSPAPIKMEENLQQFKEEDHVGITSKSPDLSQLKNPETTSLKIALLGTVQSNQKNWHAVIEETDKGKINLYKVGDSIQGAVLTTILKEKVVLRVGDQNEVLVMKEAYSPAPKQAKAMRTISLKRSEVSKDVTDISGIMKVVIIKPYYMDGVPAGIAITGIKAGSIFRKMGMRNGDIINSINGDLLNKPDDLVKLFNEFRSASDISIQITRRGNKRTINYAFRE